MNPKLTPEHLRRGAVVYVRQSTLDQVVNHTQSQRRQYALAQSARELGFADVSVIDEDLGRSGSGLVQRPGFQKLVACVCSDAIGAVFCIEASRLARNGRDWHHLIDLCALVGTIVIDHDGVYDPRVINDRLLLGLKGTMSEYELSLLRQRSLAARDAKAKRGELRFALPPGYCWDELGRIEMDPDERIVEAIRLVFDKFRELGSARQVTMWLNQQKLQLPVYRQSRVAHRIEWRSVAYHRVLSILQQPIYAGAYVFGRTGQRTHVQDGRGRKTLGHRKEQTAWNVLLRDHHPGYIGWEEFERNQCMLAENAHMQKRASRKSGRGGRALLSAIVRCARCGRMMRVLYGSGVSGCHRYQCRGEVDRYGGSVCIGIGGVRIDRAVAAQIMQAVSEHAVEAAIRAAQQVDEADRAVRQALERELEDARYEAALAARRHEAVDPSKRLVARELESRWNGALERVADIEKRIADLVHQAGARLGLDRGALLALGYDLPAAWNAPGVQPQTKQRLARILIEEVVIDINERANEAVVTIHWHGGRHTEIRVARVRVGRYPKDRHPSPVEVVRTLAGQWCDRDLAVTMNRMRCRTSDGATWTAIRVRELRERLGIAPFDPTAPGEQMITLGETAKRLGICVASVHRLIREGALPATQHMPGAPWQIPAAALDTDSVIVGVRAIKDRRQVNYSQLQDVKTLRLPGL